MKAYLWRIGKSSKPIVVGPWRSEVGFEALYWTAFLRWAKTYANLKAERMLSLTRGGAGVLYPYAGLDLYSLRSVRSVREENLYDAQRTGIQKQLHVTPWDRDVAKEAAALHFGRGQDFHLIHPALMYRALAPFWDQQRGMLFLDTLTAYSALPTPNEPVTLPDEYIAVKWYTRSTWQQHDAVTQHIQQITSHLAQRYPVVVLTSGHEGDEHTDLVVEGPNVSVMPRVAPEKSLAVQATIIKRAKAFVGTYGGMAQLALRYGVPSCSFYDQFGGTAFAHRGLSEWLAIQTKTPFVCGDLRDTDLWRMALTVPEKAA